MKAGSTSTIGRARNVIIDELQARVGELAELARSAEPVKQPGLHLSPIDCGQVEDTLGIGSTQSVAKLLAAIDRLASIKIGDIRIPFTPGQLAELQHRAQKRGRTVEAEMKAVVARIEDELFYKGG